MSSSELRPIASYPFIGEDSLNRCVCFSFSPDAPVDLEPAGLFPVMPCREPPTRPQACWSLPTLRAFSQPPVKAEQQPLDLSTTDNRGSSEKEELNSEQLESADITEGAD